MYAIAKSLQSKLGPLIFGIYGALILIGFRLFYLQIHSVDLFFSRSQKNFLRIEPVASARGNIIDSTGKLLVTNRPVVDIYWQGSGKKKLDDSDLHVLTEIGTIISSTFAADPTFMINLQNTERLHKKM